MKRSFMFIYAAALLLTGCGASADEASAQLFAMDTVMQLDAYGHQVKQAVSDAEETIQALEARLSRTGRTVWCPSSIKTARHRIYPRRSKRCFPRP